MKTNDAFDEELYLEHHGRKGMKWGQHIFTKAKSGASRVAAKGKTIVEKKRKARVKAKKAKARKKRAEVTRKNQRRADLKRKMKPVTKMTDAELQKAVKRKQLEKQYKDLKNSTKSRGRKLVEDILHDSAKNIGTQATTYIMGEMYNKAMKKKIVNSRKGQN